MGSTKAKIESRLQQIWTQIFFLIFLLGQIQTKDLGDQWIKLYYLVLS
jgi:hypothetical protein